jgi:hypothetical protein
MDKRKLHHVALKVRPIKPVYFLVLAVIFGLISVWALRQNNLNMIALRNTVYQADQNDTDIETPLRNLREYVYSHMNTNLTSGGNSIYPPIQLKYRYERLIAAQAQGASAENAKIYTDAQAECERRFPQGLSGGGRIPCIQEYVASKGVKQIDIPVSLYQFDFISPRWTPDLAGLSLVVSGVFSVLFVVSFISNRWMRHQLRD